jgi:hypothetical protein
LSGRYSIADRDLLGSLLAAFLADSPTPMEELPAALKNTLSLWLAAAENAGHSPPGLTTTGVAGGSVDSRHMLLSAPVSPLAIWQAHARLAAHVARVESLPRRLAASERFMPQATLIAVPTSLILFLRRCGTNCGVGHRAG